MKIGFLSDIHGNHDALLSVLNDMKECSIKELLIAGDLIGYYYRVDLVLEYLRDWKWTSCMGNHELLYLKWQNGTFADRRIIKKKYGSSYQEADHLLKDKQKIFLNKLSYPVTQEIDGIRFLVCHGSPDNINQYLYPDNNVIFELFKKYINKIDIVVLGHTHYQAKWEVGPLNIINPGSVGQPRSGEFNPNRVKEKCRAEWAMYDTKTMKFDFRNTFYDGSNLIKQIEKLDPEIIFLKNVLLRDLD